MRLHFVDRSVHAAGLWLGDNMRSVYLWYCDHLLCKKVGFIRDNDSFVKHETH